MLEFLVSARHTDTGGVYLAVKLGDHLAVLESVEIVAPCMRPLVSHSQVVVFLDHP